MSIANATRARVAARKETREATSVTAMCCENERSNAIKETPHAISSNIKDQGNTWSEPEADRMVLNK